MTETTKGFHKEYRIIVETTTGSIYGSGWDSDPLDLHDLHMKFLRAFSGEGVGWLTLSGPTGLPVYLPAAHIVSMYLEEREMRNTERDTR